MSETTTGPSTTGPDDPDGDAVGPAVAGVADDTDAATRREIDEARPGHGAQEMSAIDELEGISVSTRSFGQQTWDRFKKHRVAMPAGIVLVLTTIAFFAVPAALGFNELAQDTSNTFANPSLENFPELLFGTDQLGRSVFVRTLVGGQFSIFIALTVALLTTVIGTMIGAIAGYYGKNIDAVLSQIINLFLIVPLLVVLLVAAKRFNSPGSIALIIALFSWPSIARIVRGLVLQYREQEFVLAARAAGAKSGRIMLRHIIPNAFGPIIVNTTLLIGAAIILESTLSFLGVGVTPPTPTLGNLVNEAKGFITTRPHLLGPGFFVVLISLCINFLGDGLRDALDPTSRDV